MYCAPYFLKISPTASSFLRSASAAAFLTYLTLWRYRRSIVFRKASPFTVLPDPLVDGLPELGVLLAKRDRQPAAGAHGDVLVNRDAGEHLAPELGQVIVYNRDRNEAGIDHLEHIVVFEHVRGFVDHHGRFATRFSTARSAW